MSTRKVTRKVFYGIQAALKNTKDTQKKIADSFGVGASTVSRINICRTWENYLAERDSDRPVRRSTLKRPKPESQLEQRLKQVENYPMRSEHNELQRRITILSTQLAGITETPLIGGILRRRMAKAVQRLKQERD